MSIANLVGHITVRNAKKWIEYLNQVPVTLGPWGAEITLREKRVATFSGEEHQGANYTRKRRCLHDILIGVSHE